MDEYLPIIEWEILQERFQFSTIVKPDFLIATIESMEISRNEEYKIKAKLIGKYDQAIKNPIPRGKPGKKVESFELIGSEMQGTIKYHLEHCYWGNITNNMKLDSTQKYINYSKAELITDDIKIDYQNASKRKLLTEWFINSPESGSFCSRNTTRKYSSQYIRNRNIEELEEIKLLGSRGQGDSVDYSFINIGKRRFILHSIPSCFGPDWCEKLGIEFREDLGGIPDQEERRAISEIVSFILGGQLLSVGHTEFDEKYYPIKAFVKNPWGNAKQISNYSKYQPIKIRPYYRDNNPEIILGKLIPRYLELREHLYLSEALWRYWISMRLPIGVNLPILATGIEILALAWFKYSKSNSKGVYLEKKVWDALLKDEFESISSKLECHQYNNRMINRVKNAFQMGFNDRFEMFFEEIGLQLGGTEKQAMKERNRMIHASTGDSPSEIEHMIKMTNTYMTLFHRVLLKMLDYEGNYIDYSTPGWPELSIDNPAGSSQ